MLSYLSSSLLDSYHHSAVDNPQKGYENFPAKILQFGSGNFLRGFVGFFVEKANRKGIFRGRIIVVQSTNQRATDTFSKQDCLYTLLEQGILRGVPTRQFTIVSAIQSCISAQQEWEKVLKYAENSRIHIIVSNTTEAGIVLDAQDSIFQTPPSSFPAKLLAVLYRRWQTYGSQAKGFVILPCELLVENGTQLKSIVEKLAELHQLPNAFVEWLQTQNLFCNTLVDRIVPGKPSDLQEIFQTLGYVDHMLTACEFYRLWAIEGNQDELIAKVPFLSADEGIVIAPDITPYRERKLRILNGGHTIAAALGFLKGFTTVDECLQDSEMKNFFRCVILDEIAKTLPYDEQETTFFAQEVLTRFSNPFLHHQLLSICLEYTTKMRMRNVPTFFRYYEKFNKLPVLMCKGFAAFLVFMLSVKEENGKFVGEWKGKTYSIQDTHAPVWIKKNAVFPSQPLETYVHQVVSDTTLWGQNLASLPGFVNAVAHEMQILVS
ncbi:MAG: tagaturonate reductase [Cytophagales bacterium]|nr:tagaturonate reductase [Cytophagales bacterium]MDW8384384.1 tagaturonate reductase [Flammeovirgaceae bacterium]